MKHLKIFEEFENYIRKTTTGINRIVLTDHQKEKINRYNLKVINSDEIIQADKYTKYGHPKIKIIPPKLIFNFNGKEIARILKIKDLYHVSFPDESIQFENLDDAIDEVIMKKLN